MGLDRIPMGRGVSLWVLGHPYGSWGVLWGCGEPTEGFYGAVRGVLVGWPYGSRWRVPMGLGVSLWVSGCPYGSWGVPMGL